jgi:hypothetical protein
VPTLSEEKITNELRLIITPDTLPSEQARSNIRHFVSRKRTKFVRLRERNLPTFTVSRFTGSCSAS